MNCDTVKNDKWSVHIGFVFIFFLIMAIVLIIFRIFLSMNYWIFGDPLVQNILIYFSYFQIRLFNCPIASFGDILTFLIIINILFAAINIFRGSLFIIIKLGFYLAFLLGIFWPFAWLQLGINFGGILGTLGINIWFFMTIIIAGVVIKAIFDFLDYFADDYRSPSSKDHLKKKDQANMTTITLGKVWIPKASIHFGKKNYFNQDE